MSPFWAAGVCFSTDLLRNLQKYMVQNYLLEWQEVQFSSVQMLSRVRLCDPMNCITPGLPVHHQLPEFPQTHFHQVGDVIQPSRPLSSPSPPAPNPSQHQGLFQWVNSSHEVAKVLASPSNEHPGLISFRMDWLDLLAIKNSQESSPTP